MFDRNNYGISMDDNIIGYHFRDQERELYVQQLEFEQELERARSEVSKIALLIF